MRAKCCPDNLHDPATEIIGNSQMREHQINLTALHGDQGTLHAQPQRVCLYCQSKAQLNKPNLE